MARNGPRPYCALFPQPSYGKIPCDDVRTRLAQHGAAVRSRIVFLSMSLFEACATGQVAALEAAVKEDTDLNERNAVDSVSKR